MANTENEQKPQLTSEDADKLGLPTSLEDIFSYGEEGKSIADDLALIVGGDKKDDLSILQRTKLSQREASIIADTIFVARFPLIWTNEWVRKVNKGDWFIPELRDYAINLLRARTSIDGRSIEKFVEALQAIKIKVESQKQTLLSQQ